MDSTFWIGTGLTILFGFLAFAVKRVPSWIALPAVVAGALMTLWGLLPYSHRASIQSGSGSQGLTSTAAPARRVSKALPQRSAPAQTGKGPKQGRRTAEPAQANAELVSSTASAAPESDHGVEALEGQGPLLDQVPAAAARKQGAIGDKIFALLLSADTEAKFLSATEQFGVWDHESATLVATYWGEAGRKYYLSTGSTGEIYSPSNFGIYTDPRVYWERQRQLGLVRARQAALDNLADRAQESARK